MQYTYFLSIFLSHNLFSQNKRIETLYDECFYDIIGTKENKYKSYLKNFEKYLIEENVLKDSTAVGYYKLLKYISNKKTFTKRLNYSLDSLGFFVNYEESNTAKIKCQKKYEHHKGVEAFEQKIKKFPKTPSELTNGVLENYTKLIEVKDLELPFYKRITLLLTDLIFEMSYDMPNPNFLPTE